MGKDQQPTAGSSSSKTEKSQFRFSLAGKTFLKDYFHNTNKAPKKKERQQILAHLKELGDTEVTDARISNWFIYTRREDKKRPTLSLSTSALEPDEGKWVDARHKSLWPSLTKESLEHLEKLYAQDDSKDDPPYELWAEGLDAKPAHVGLWCKFKVRESNRQSRPAVTQVATTSSQMPDEHSQLPTPGSSISPEPPAFTASLPPSPSAIKHEPPKSPVVDTTRFGPQSEGPKEKSSLGLHEAIESAFSAPLCPPAPSIQPQKPLSLTIRINQQRKSSSRSPRRATSAIPPPAPLSISTNATTLTPTSFPSASITPPSPNPAPSPPLSHREPSVPPSPEEPTPGPSTQPDRNIARERASVATGIAAKLNELSMIFSTPHGLSQFAGSTQGISQRNQQFLDDVAAGRFAHMHLTSAHLPDRQVGSQMPEFNPQRILAGWRDSKGKGKERAKEDGMGVD